MTMSRRQILAALAGAAGAAAIGTATWGRSRPDPTAFMWRQAAGTLDDWRSPPDSLGTYVARYATAFPNLEMCALDQAQYRIVGLRASPSTVRGTVIVLHGYFDHMGIFAPYLRDLIELGWAVAAYDLPGHGLSSGTSGAVSSFTDYTAILTSFLARLGAPRPWFAIGHSTGCCALIDAALSGVALPVDASILVAPLVRSAKWGLGHAAHTATARWLHEVPRVYTESSGDAAFLQSLLDDPLEGRVVSGAWMSALIDWNASIEAREPVSAPLHVIQGTADGTVAWEYNLQFIANKLRDSEIHRVPNGRHHLLFESEPMRTAVRGWVAARLH